MTSLTQTRYGSRSRRQGSGRRWRSNQASRRRRRRTKEGGEITEPEAPVRDGLTLAGASGSRCRGVAGVTADGTGKRCFTPSLPHPTVAPLDSGARAALVLLEDFGGGARRAGGRFGRFLLGRLAAHARQLHDGTTVGHALAVVEGRRR